MRPSIPAKQPTATSTAATRKSPPGAVAPLSPRPGTSTTPSCSAASAAAFGSRHPQGAHRGRQGPLCPAWAVTATPPGRRNRQCGGALKQFTTCPDCSLSSQSEPSPHLYLNYGGDYAGRTDYANAASTTLGLLCGVLPKLRALSPAPLSDRADILAGARGRPLGRSLRGCCRLRFASSLELRLHQPLRPRYNGAVHRLHSRRLLRRADRDVQEMTGGYWYDIYKGEHAPASGHPVRLCGP